MVVGVLEGAAATGAGFDVWELLVSQFSPRTLLDSVAVADSERNREGD